MCQQWPWHPPKTHLNHTDSFLPTSSRVGLPSAISTATLHPILKPTICSYTGIFVNLLCSCACAAQYISLRDFLLSHARLSHLQALQWLAPGNAAFEHTRFFPRRATLPSCSKPLEGPQKHPTPPMTASQYSLEKKGAEHLPLYRSLEKKGYNPPPFSLTYAATPQTNRYGSLRQVLSSVRKGTNATTIPAIQFPKSPMAS